MNLGDIVFFDNSGTKCAIGLVIEAKEGYYPEVCWFTNNGLVYRREYFDSIRRVKHIEEYIGDEP